MSLIIYDLAMTTTDRVPEPGPDDAARLFRGWLERIDGLLGE
jgi:hypothetical protein